MSKPEISTLKKQTSEKIKPAIESDELLAVMEDKKQAKRMAKDLYKGKAVDGVAEATPHGESPAEQVLAARRSVEAALSAKLKDNIRRTTAGAVIEDSEVGTGVASDKKKIIDDAPIEKVYAILMAQKDGEERFIEITDKEARRIEPYKSIAADGFLDPGQVLRDDLAAKFEQIQAVRANAEAQINERITGLLQKKHDSTKAYIQARRGAENLRLGKEAGKTDITALSGNAEGTLHAAKYFETAIGKTDKILFERTYRDPETKTYMREVAYKVQSPDASGRPAVSKDEVVVEVWNVGKNGGNLVRSSLVKINTIKGKEWRFKGFRNRRFGIFPKRHEVDKPATIMAKKGFIKNRFRRANLSDAVREQLDEVTPEMIEASTRDSSYGAGISRHDDYALTDQLGAHNAALLGLGKRKAKQATKSPGFIGMLSARIFNSHKKISKKDD